MSCKTTDYPKTSSHWKTEAMLSFRRDRGLQEASDGKLCHGTTDYIWNGFVSLKVWLCRSPGYCGRSWRYVDEKQRSYLSRHWELHRFPWVTGFLGISKWRVCILKFLTHLLWCKEAGLHSAGRNSERVRGHGMSPFWLVLRDSKLPGIFCRQTEGGHWWDTLFPAIPWCQIWLCAVHASVVQSEPWGILT